MHIDQLPESASIVKSDDISKISEALRRVNPYFDRFCLVYGVQHSGRMFFFGKDHAPNEAVYFPSIMTADAIAEELMRLTNSGEARYNPPVNPDSGKCRGWDIRVVFIRSAYAAVAQATWVDS